VTREVLFPAFAGKSCVFPALPKEVLAILNDGGLIPHVKKLLGKA
jgi:hypothetical protein